MMDIQGATVFFLTLPAVAAFVAIALAGCSFLLAPIRAVILNMTAQPSWVLIPDAVQRRPAPPTPLTTERVIAPAYSERLARQRLMTCFAQDQHAAAAPIRILLSGFVAFSGSAKRFWNLLLASTGAATAQIGRARQSIGLDMKDMPADRTNNRYVAALPLMVLLSRSTHSTPLTRANPDVREGGARHQEPRCRTGSKSILALTYYSTFGSKTPQKRRFCILRELQSITTRAGRGERWR